MKRNFISRYVRRFEAGVDTYFLEEVLVISIVALVFIVGGAYLLSWLAS